MKAYREYNLSPETLWKMVVSEVGFPSEFFLYGEHKDKADRELAQLKRTIMQIANNGGGKYKAMQVVMEYNKAMNEILAEVFEPVRDDFQVNVPVKMTP